MARTDFNMNLVRAVLKVPILDFERLIQNLDCELLRDMKKRN